jgi:hypothetical protein
VALSMLLFTWIRAVATRVAPATRAVDDLATNGGAA